MSQTLVTRAQLPIAGRQRPPPLQAPFPFFEVGRAPGGRVEQAPIGEILATRPTMDLEPDCPSDSGSNRPGSSDNHVWCNPGFAPRCPRRWAAGPGVAA